MTLVDKAVVERSNQARLSDHPWMGQRFPHGSEPFGHHLGFKKSIRPTRNIFQGGLHMAGACHLPPPWNGCPVDSPDPHAPCLGMGGR